MFSSNFLKACVGLSLVFSSLSLLIFSINKANATPEFPLSAITSSPQFVGGSNEIMMAPFSRTVYNDEGDQSYQESDVLVWNARTGVSALYYFGYKDGKYGYYKMFYKLPDNPLK